MAWNPTIPTDHAEPPFRCPTSGVLLGAVVKSFGLDDPQVGGEHAAKHLGSEASLGRAAREYFRGAWVAEPKRRELCRWTVQAALHAGLLHGLQLPAGVNGTPAPPLEDFLTRLLDRWLANWDFIYYRGTSGWPYPPRHLSGLVLGRQVVIDLALRVAAVIQLMGGCPSDAVIPYAGDNEPGRSMLQSLILVAQKEGAAQRIQDCFEVIGDWPKATREWDTGEQTNSIPAEERRQRQVAVALIAMSPRSFADELYPVVHNGDPARVVQWSAHVAKGYMARDQHAQALPLWQKVVAAEPDNADQHCHYGICLWRANPGCDFNGALAQLRRASELRPDWDYPVAEIARVYLHRGWTDHALDQFERAPKNLVESSQDCSFTLGLTLVRLKRFADAKAAIDRACRMDPTHADAWDLAAECAFQVGDKVEGRRCAREALRLGLRRSYDQWVRPLDK